MGELERIELVEGFVVSEEMANAEVVFDVGKDGEGLKGLGGS